MNKHLWIALALVFAAGCATKTAEPAPVMGSGQGFIKEWQADLNIGDQLTALYVRENAVIAYTNTNRGFWLSASGGQVLGSSQIVTEGHKLYPPVLLTSHTAIPTSVSIEAFDRNGRRLDSFSMPTAVQSPAVGAGETIYLGVSHPGSGRLAKFNIVNGLRMAWEMWTSDGIFAMPAIYNDVIYAGGLDGRVWAVTSARQPIWSLQSNAFDTNEPITADLSVDEYGVYIASQDKRLYCLDRNSGRVRWMYYATAPLIDQPIVAGNSVYQLVPNLGLVALSKNDGKYAREPLWIQPIAGQVLSVDEKYLYVRAGRGTILALDRTTGEPVFHSNRDDLDLFATNVKGSTIYAATRSGSIIAIKPILKPGTVGEIVWNEKAIGDALAMGW